MRSSSSSDGEAARERVLLVRGRAPTDDVEERAAVGADDGVDAKRTAPVAPPGVEVEVVDVLRAERTVERQDVALDCAEGRQVTDDV